MSVRGPLILALKDKDDQELFASAIQSLGLPNKIKTFEDGTEVYDYLISTRENPFIIIADLKLSKMDGLELCAKINENPGLKKKSIPFLIFAELVHKNEVNEGYLEGIQGFFVKPNNVEELNKILRIITEYWSTTVEPNQLVNEL